MAQMPLACEFLKIEKQRPFLFLPLCHLRRCTTSRHYSSPAVSSGQYLWALEVKQPVRRQAEGVWLSCCWVTEATQQSWKVLSDFNRKERRTGELSTEMWTVFFFVLFFFPIRGQTKWQMNPFWRNIWNLIAAKITHNNADHSQPGLSRICILSLPFSTSPDTHGTRWRQAMCSPYVRFQAWKKKKTLVVYDPYVSTGHLTPWTLLLLEVFWFTPRRYSLMPYCGKPERFYWKSIGESLHV